jgi:CelD/BcsL family acetyltransferase involved in cellulose biosynthesis
VIPLSGNVSRQAAIQSGRSSRRNQVQALSARRETLAYPEGGSFVLPMSNSLSERIRTLDSSGMEGADFIPDNTSSQGLTAKSERGTVELLDRIGDEWRQLCQEGPCDQPFFRPEWIASSIRAFASKHPVLLITVRDGNRLRAVLPLLEEKTRAYGFPVTKLRSAANPDHSPRFDFIHGQGPGIEEALEAGWNELKNHHWEVIELVNVPEGGAAELLLRGAREDGFLTYQYLCARTPYILLGGYKPGADFSQFARSPRFRYKLRHRWRSLEKTGTILLRRVEAADREILQQFYGLEQRGWKGKRGTAIACNGETRQFYDSIANYAAQYGYLSLYFLRQGDAAVAAHFALTYGGRYYPLKIAYDETYSQYGPGHLIAGAVLRDCAARGVSEFDWLGHWTEAKAEWASEVRPHNFCYIFRPSLAGRILRAQTLLGHRLREAFQRLKHSLGIVRQGHTPPNEHA